MYSSSTRVGGVIVIFGVGSMIMDKTLGVYPFPRCFVYTAIDKNLANKRLSIRGRVWCS